MKRILLSLALMSLVSTKVQAANATVASGTLMREALVTELVKLAANQYTGKNTVIGKMGRLPVDILTVGDVVEILKTARGTAKTKTATPAAVAKEVGKTYVREKILAVTLAAASKAGLSLPKVLTDNHGACELVKALGLGLARANIDAALTSAETLARGGKADFAVVGFNLQVNLL